MSLDLLVCKVVKPQDANNTYSVIHPWEEPALRRIQQTGYICVKEERIAANCMSEKWHNLFYQTQNSKWDTPEEPQRHDIELSEMKVIFPDQIEEKLIKWFSEKGTTDLIKKIKELVEKKEIDFFYISW